LFHKNDLSFFIFSKYNASTDSLICSFRTIWYQKNGKMRIRRSIYKSNHKSDRQDNYICILNDETTNNILHIH
jgi:hypothetical protein